MFEDVLGETGGTIAQFGLALVAVIALIFIVAWLLRRLGLSKIGGHHGDDVELEVVTSVHVDSKRKLVLVRHGRLEHLLLIGGGSDEVVERSMVGGIPLSARMQASKAQERQDEPTARPADRYRTPNRFTSLLSRKKEDEQPAAAGSIATPTAAAAAAATAASSAAPAKTGSAEPAAPKETSPPSSSKQASTSDLAPATAAMQDEREALSESVDTALTQSLLDEPAKPAGEATDASLKTDRPPQPALTPHAPQPSAAPQTPEPDQATKNPTGADLDTSALERELEAALELDGFETPPTDAPDAAEMPAGLPDLSTLTDDTPDASTKTAHPSGSPIEPPAPSASEAKDQGPSDQADTSAAAAMEATDAPDGGKPADQADDPLDLSSLKADSPTGDLPPGPDIPVALSGRDEPPIAVTIPTRGPASNATTLAKAEDAKSAADAPNTEEPPAAVDISGKLQPSTKNAPVDEDLDNEMRRLLGEIAGEPTPK